MEASHPQTEKKKIPGWAKFLIVVAILGVVGLTIVGIGLKVLAGMFLTKGGQYLSEQGLEKGIEKIIEKGLESSGEIKANVDLTKEGITIKDEKSGQQLAIQAGQQLPANFPSDIPIFSPSQITANMVMGPTIMVTMESSSSLSDISSFYQRELPAKEWISLYTPTTSNENFTGIYTKNNRRLVVSVNAEGQKTAIMLTYGAEPPPP